MVTSMSLKWLSKVYAKLKPELLTTQVLRFGKAVNMGLNAIYGLLEFYFMSCALFRCLLQLAISPPFTAESVKAPTMNCLNNILPNCGI